MGLSRCLCYLAFAAPFAGALVGPAGIRPLGLVSAPRSRFAAPAAARPLALRAAKEGDGAPDEELLAVEVSGTDEFLIQWGLKEDPRVPEDCRVDPMTRVKESGKAGIAAYTITEFAFWLSSVPLAIAAVAATTGSLPDVGTIEGKEAVGGYVFVFINFARAIVPVRIALALALAPWCDENIIKKYFPPKDEEPCVVDE